MTAVDIGRLRVRGPPHLAAWTAFAIEDACRTALPDGERLVLVRRLDLGRSARRRADQAAALRRGWVAATAGARHGGGDGAAAANCVWFASRAEARRLLLAALLAGRRPLAWYWRLAVPGWSGQPLEQWLAHEIEAALAGEDEADLIGIVALAVEAGAAESLIRALGGAAGAQARAPPGGSAAVLPSAAPPPIRPDAKTAEAVHAAVRDTVLRLREQLPPALPEAVEALVRRIGPTHRASAALVERLLLIASPPLALAPALLRDLVDAYRDEIAAPRPARFAASAVPAAPPRVEPRAPCRDAAKARLPDVTTPALAADAIPAVARAPDPASLPAPAEPMPSESPWRDAIDERETAAAGLWLAIPALIRMGFREWLVERPFLLSGDPGRTLIRTIAAHHRVPPGDPALAPLALPGEDFGPPLWAGLWRVGLDRWLRRRARVPLARLVWRRGWLRQSDERLIIRFPPQAADIRLRRHALDVDPGWTDWIALSVRYLYAERAAW